MPDPTWDILINSLDYRSPKLARLLDILKPQIVPGVNVRALVSPPVDWPTTIREFNTLIESSTADYTCFVDDDDLVADNYVGLIVAALASRPDYVGFNVVFVDGGRRMPPVAHGLWTGSGWWEDERGYWRDITHLNPIRRELVLPWPVDDGPVCDQNWAANMRATETVQTEVYIDAELYFYTHDLSDSVTDRRVMMGRGPGTDLTDQFPWVEWL